MSIFFHFNVDPGYLGATSEFEIAVVTFIQMYETVADQFYKIPEGDLVAKGIIADSISQIVDILSEIKKWDLNDKFHNMKVEYINIMKDHYNEITKELSSD